MTHIIKIRPDTYHQYHERIIEIETISFASPWSVHAFSAEIEKPYSQLWAYITEATLTGYICFWIVDMEVQLLNVAVHPRYRRQHLGCQLMLKMIEIALTRNSQTIWLEVRPSNTVALCLYEKCGFHSIGRRPGYYSDTNEDAILMKCELPLGGNNLRISNEIHLS